MPFFATTFTLYFLISAIKLFLFFSTAKSFIFHCDGSKEYPVLETNTVYSLFNCKFEKLNSPLESVLETLPVSFISTIASLNGALLYVTLPEIVAETSKFRFSLSLLNFVREIYAGFDINSEFDTNIL